MRAFRQSPRQSLRHWLPRWRRRQGASCWLGIFLILSGCDSLWRPFAADDPANCVQNPRICESGQVCSPTREVCEPALVLSKVEPARGPSSGGTLIRITGESFTAGMTVAFQGAPATGVTLISPQQLQVVLPALPGVHGAVPVTLEQPDAQKVSRSDLFTYYPETLGFAAGRSQATGRGPQLVAVADFNLDGRLDFATSDYGSGTVSVSLGQGDGTFGQPSATVISATAFGLLAADVDGDSRVDLVTSTYGAGTITLLLSNGDGTFRNDVTIPTGGGPSSVAAGFVDGDDLIDLAVANHNANTVSLLLNQGKGVFQPGGTLTAPGCTWVAFADLGAGRASDLAVASDSAPQVFVYPSNRDGTYKPYLPLDVGQVPRSLELSDFNRDGFPDLAVADYGSGDVAILLGAAGPSFAPAKYYSTGAAPYTISLGDLNGDGVTDLITGNPQGNSVSLLLGVGDGSFGAPVMLAAELNTRHVGLGDFDGDGLIDLAAGNYNSSTVSVFLNTSR